MNDNRVSKHLKDQNRALKSLNLFRVSHQSNSDDNTAVLPRNKVNRLEKNSMVYLTFWSITFLIQHLVSNTKGELIFIQDNVSVNKVYLIILQSKNIVTTGWPMCSPDQKVGLSFILYVKPPISNNF